MERAAIPQTLEDIGDRARAELESLHRAREGAYTASSHHGGGVHVMAMDGHVEFVSDSIALRVWRGIGSRNGDEVVSWP